VSKYTLKCLFPPAIFDTPTIKYVSCYHDGHSENHRNIQWPIIERMNRNRGENTYCHPQPHRANRKETPESEKSHKDMHRHGKKCPSDKLWEGKIMRKVGDIFEKSESDSHKRTHNSWINIHERLKPFTELFIKRRLKCLRKKSSYRSIQNSWWHDAPYHHHDHEWYQREKSPPSPNRRQCSKKKYKRNQKPLIRNQNTWKIRIDDEERSCDTNTS